MNYEFQNRKPELSAPFEQNAESELPEPFFKCKFPSLNFVKEFRRFLG